MRAGWRGFLCHAGPRRGGSTNMPRLDNTGFLDRKLTAPHHANPPTVTPEDLERWGISKVEHAGNVVVHIPYPAFKTIAPASAHRFEAERYLNAILALAGIDVSKRYRSQTEADFSVTFSQRMPCRDGSASTDDRAHFATVAVRGKEVAGSTGARSTLRNPGNSNSLI